MLAYWLYITASKIIKILKRNLFMNLQDAGNILQETVSIYRGRSELDYQYQTVQSNENLGAILASKIGLFSS